MHDDKMLPSLAVLLTGGFLGLSLATALHRGRSAVPGVTRLAAVITDGTRPIRPTRPNRVAGEVVPASVAVGRGDEVAPPCPGRRR